MKEKAFPILYILMRNDLDSLNPGKAVAQGSHATSIFTRAIENMVGDKNLPLVDMYKTWLENRDFGTVLTLGVDERQLRGVVELARQLGDTLAGDVLDPTYPLRDGKTTHFIPLTTCGFVFGEKAKLGALLAQFDLLP